MLLAVRTDGRFRAVAAASADPRPMSELGRADRDLAAALTGSAGVRSWPAGRHQAALTEASALLVRERTGCCSARSRYSDRPRVIRCIGVLAVFGEQRILADLSATMEILAHQVALAAERIMLRQEVIRQGNEAYFRTLVQDTSDAILIVGDDGKIRYATPSATSIFGDISVEGAYLRDLVADGRAR